MSEQRPDGPAAPPPSGALGTGAPAVDLTRSRSVRSAAEGAVKAALLAAAAISVATTALIVYYLTKEAVGFFREVSVGEFLGTKWVPLTNSPSFGVLPLLLDTLLITLIALAVAVPIGLLCAIYLSEYATPRVRRLVKPVLELLAGVPTIVFAYFALTFVTPDLLKALLGGGGVDQYNMLAGGLIVGLLVIPTIASVAEDAMSAVPGSLREGAYGLGADRRQVSTRIVFPAALSGIVAALVLGASRAFGETMVILLASGSGTNLLGVHVDPTREGGSMAAFIAGAFGGDIPTQSIQFRTVFVVGFLLFVITLVLNMISTRLVNKFRQVYE